MSTECPHIEKEEEGEEEKEKEIHSFVLSAERKDLLDDLKKECGFPKTDYRFTIAAMICGYELEIVEGENRLFLARKI